MNHHIWSNSGQSLPAQKLAFSTLRPKSLTHPGCELPSPVRWWRVPPGHPTVPFHLYLSDSEFWSSIRRQQEPPGQTTLPFPPHGRRDLPIQTASIFLPSDVGESLPVTQLTFLSLPVRHSESWSPVGCRREPPGQTTLPFQTSCSTRLTRPTQRFWNHRRTSARASRTDKLSFSILRLARPTQPRCRLTARPSDLLTLPFCLNPSDSASTDPPDGRRREHSRPDNLIFSSPCSTRLTRPSRRFWNHSRTLARASQPDNLRQSPLVPSSSLSSPLAPSSSHSSALIPTSSVLPKRPWDSALPERPRDSALPERPQEPAPFQELTESTPEPAPFQELTESTPEPAPFQELTESTPEPAPFQEITESTPEPAPVQELTGSTPEPAPVQELTESTPEPAPVQELTESTPEPAPVQELTETTPERPTEVVDFPKKIEAGLPTMAARVPWSAKSPDPPWPPEYPCSTIGPGTGSKPIQTGATRAVQHPMGRGGALEASRHMETGQVASRAVPVPGPMVDQWGNVRPVSPFLLCPYMVLPVLVLSLLVRWIPALCLDYVPGVSS